MAVALVVFQSSYSIYDLAQNAVLTSGAASILISLSLFPRGHATG